MSRNREITTGRRSAPSDTNSSRLATLILAGSAAFSLAGPLEVAEPLVPPAEARDRCDVYKNIGKLYSDQHMYAGRADADHSVGLLNGGRGDEHHSIYGGLNYCFCGDNAKVMAGLQYDDISAGGRDVYDGWTAFLAFRTFF